MKSKWAFGRSQKKKSTTLQLKRKALRLRLELLEDRLVLDGGVNALGLLLPAASSIPNPFGIGQRDLPTAQATGLYNLILGRAPDAAGLAFWSGVLHAGTSPANVVQSFLSSPEHSRNVVESYFQSLLGRSPEPAAADFWSANLGAFTNITSLAVGLSTSTEYQQLHGDSADFVRSLYTNIHGRNGSESEVQFWIQVLASGGARGVLTDAFVTSTEFLTQAVQQFYQLFLLRTAEPGGLSYWVGQAHVDPLSQVLGKFLSTPEAQFVAAGGTAAQAYDNYYGLNQFALVADSVTDPVSSGGNSVSSLVPKNSPWGQSIVFPSVSYDQIQTGKAVQPTLQLPSDIVNAFNLTDGATVQFWFQAKNPGVLLSTSLATTGDTATGSYNAPLVYIDADGHLMAGLFDQTALAVVPNQSPLSWKADDGTTQVGAANPLRSQSGVLDNTWHHVAVTFSKQSQSLYVDGLLQGTSQPQFHQVSAGLTSNTTTLIVPLTANPTPGQLISGTIAQLNPASDTTYGPGGSTEAFRFQGWLTASGQVSLNLTSTGNSTAVTSVTYIPATGNTSALLSLQLSVPLNSANAVSIETSYLTANSAYSLQPASSSTYSTPVNSNGGGTSKVVTFSAPSGLNVGGTIVPEPTSKLYPTVNYPQGFVGTIDEVALWTAQLTQAQVQEAMSGPALPASGTGGILPDKLVGYFPFTQTVTGHSNEWSNMAPGASTFATGPTTGTVLAQVGSTIPTDPFTDAARLPGARNYGLSIMTPLASPSISVTDGVAVKYKVGLSAGDQLEISLPAQLIGHLELSVEDDLGRVSPQISISPDAKQYLPAGRTGTYQLTLKWVKGGVQPLGEVDFALIPGPLNSLMGLVASYKQGVSQDQTNVVQAYSDPALPGINSTIGTAGATGAANYFPLWTDTTYFPATNAYTAADLNTSYQKLVTALIGLNKGLTDFANISGSTVTNPATILQLLAQSYTAAFQQAPPTPTGSDPFPVAPEATAQEAVYKFFYNTNLLRMPIYAVLTGSGNGANPNSLPSWVQGVINAIASTNVPLTIATDISTGQTKQVHDIPVNVFQPSQKQTVGDILLDGVIWSADIFLAAIPGGLEAAEGIQLVVSALLDGGAAIGQSFVDNAFDSGAGNSTINVPVTSITNSELNYASLVNMAGSIRSGMSQLWNNILIALTSDALAQSVLSNFGLIKALAVINGTPLSKSYAAPNGAVETALTRASWQQMIPATFTWNAVAPPAFPTGNGQTNDWVASGPNQLGGGEEPMVHGITNADFNNDGKLDVAVANYKTSNITILLGTGGGDFSTGTTVSLDPADGSEGPDGAFGIISGDFNSDGKPDIILSDYSTSVLSILLGKGDGSFQAAVTIDLNGPDGPIGLVAGDFNTDGKLDVAVATELGSAVSVLLGKGDGSFETAVTNPVPENAWSVATGDFNKDGKLDLAETGFSSTTNQSGVSVLLGNGDGSFQAPIPLDMGDNNFGSQSIVVGDLNGDGVSDIAVTNAQSDGVSVFLGEGDGNFHARQDYAVSGGDSPTGIALLPTIGGLPNLAVTNAGDSSSVNIFYNRGNGTFLPPVNVPLSSSTYEGITVGDFAGDGLGQIALADYTDSTVVILSRTGVGNTATFLPGTSTSSAPLAGPTNLQSTTDSTDLSKLLTQLQSLQGGNIAYMGPFDKRSLITPSGTTPPNFMAFTSLAYPGSNVPLSLVAPGMFLSITPATLNETANNNGTALSYTQNGAYLNGWQLLDSNSNPIAGETLLQLFGTPSQDAKGRPVGTNLTPVDPSNLFAAFNNGWYFNAEPVAGAAASWADAFFGWGLGANSYSPRDLAPSSPLVGELPNSTTNGVTSSNINYKLTFQPASTAPPAINSGVPVTLTGMFNRLGIVKDGTDFSDFTGFDGQGYAISGTLLGSSVIANGTQFALGSFISDNVIVANGQTITLPGGSFATLNLLGAGAATEQSPVTFTVNYTDGTSKNYTQEISSYVNPQGVTGESTAVALAYRNFKDGSNNAQPSYLYAYKFALDATKTIKSIVLPENDNVIVVGMTLT